MKIIYYYIVNAFRNSWGLQPIKINPPKYDKFIELTVLNRLNEKYLYKKIEVKIGKSIVVGTVEHIYSEIIEKKIFDYQKDSLFFKTYKIKNKKYAANGYKFIFAVKLQNIENSLLKDKMVYLQVLNDDQGVNGWTNVDKWIKSIDNIKIVK